MLYINLLHSIDTYTVTYHSLIGVNGMQKVNESDIFIVNTNKQVIKRKCEDIDIQITFIYTSYH